jgi:NADPH:quinone reductase-like Zn-dependent oxidoreductase
VLTEDEARTPAARAAVLALGRDTSSTGTASSAPTTSSAPAAGPRLALNAVGGASALTLLRLVADGGTVVTYGGMSRQPLTVLTGALIFRDITFRGFWMTRWTEQQPLAARAAMLEYVAALLPKETYALVRAFAVVRTAF